MNKKYQVFISSTYKDLKAEREQVTKAILEMGHIPIGMEMFSAADEEQWELIKRSIDEADYYVVLVAHRYGSTVDGTSFTEKEYDYAKSKGTPCLGFVIDSSASWPASKMDQKAQILDKLDSFKGKVTSKLVNFWKTGEDLHGKVSIALMKQMHTNPQSGWVPASEDIAPAVTSELTRLSNENADLREKLKKAQEKALTDNTRERHEVITALKNNTQKISFFYEDSSNWEDSKDVSLLQIFALLAPELLIEKSSKSIGEFLAIMLNKSARTPRAEYPIPTNTIRSMIANFVALNLLEPSKKKHPVKDDNEYWTLTSLGKDSLLSVNRSVLMKAKENDSGSSLAGLIKKKVPKKKVPKKKIPKKKVPKKKTS